ncbi:MAG: methyltransferase domain-containing protein [Candidatus Binatia bacterium]
MGAGNTESNDRVIDHEGAVLDRYEAAALNAEVGLCVPVHYDPVLLEVIPDEIMEKDYGCGDPSRYVREGETVLDLGSGSGKACYIMGQIAGPRGKVIGVDFNDAMLAVARKYQDSIAHRLGYRNVEFRRGKIQDLRMNPDLIDAYLARRPVRSVAELQALRDFEERAAREQPLVADETIDVVVSNCVLNLVRPDQKRQLFAEMHRVLKRGGRIAVSDIVGDEAVPEHLTKDPELWSGCVSGAFQEEEFLRAFEQAGFYGIHMEEMSREPYRTVEGIEFRSVTVTAYKGKEGPCLEKNEAVIYRGPWKQVVDDDNHLIPRGARIAVCEKTYQIYSRPPYRDQFILIPPRVGIAPEKAGVFDCSRDQRRHPRETKGLDYKVTDSAESLCSPGSACCS